MGLFASEPFFSNLAQTAFLAVDLLIYCGFGCKAIAASYEISEHIGDNWFYVSQISDLNRLFYTFITAGTCLMALGLKKSRILDLLLIASLFAVPLAYGVQGGEGLMQAAQLISAGIFVFNWYVVMRNWRVFLYLLLSNVVALGFGIAYNSMPEVIEIPIELTRFELPQAVQARLQFR